MLSLYGDKLNLAWLEFGTAQPILLISFFINATLTVGKTIYLYNFMNFTDFPPLYLFSVWCQKLSLKISLYFFSIKHHQTSLRCEAERGTQGDWIAQILSYKLIFYKIVTSNLQPVADASAYLDQLVLSNTNPNSICYMTLGVYRLNKIDISA